MVIAPTGHTSIRLPESSEWTPCSLNVAIWLSLPRATTPICGSPSISRMKRMHRVQRMQRLRFNISVGPKSTSAFTPSPSNVRRGNSIRLSLRPNEYEKSWSGHSPPLSQTGQSSGWFTSRNSKTPARAWTTSGALVDTTIPSAHVVEQAVCSFAIFSILTMQTRQDPSIPSPG